MKKICLAVLAITALSTVASAGCLTKGKQGANNTFLGLTHCSNITLSSLTVKGAFEGSRMTVTGDVSTQGRANLDELLFEKDYTAQGRVDANKITVGGDTKIQGAANISEAQLNNTTIYGGVNLVKVLINGDLTYASNLAKLSSVKVANITADHVVTSPNNRPILLCLSNSTVTGDITVKDNDAKVYIDDASTVKGKITGADVEHGTCPR